MSEDMIYFNLVRHYEECLKRFGDSHRGVDWTNATDALKRYQVMLDIIYGEGGKDQSLLDFGCGTAALYDYIHKKGYSNIKYSGLDISSSFIDVCRHKYPNMEFLNLDILDLKNTIPRFDYIIMNGVFTVKLNLSFDYMCAYFCAMITRIFPFSEKGIAFNLRADYVLKKEDDLFHVPMDWLARFLTQNLTEHFVIRNDYDLEEYTVYIYHEPRVLGSQFG